MQAISDAELNWRDYEIHSRREIAALMRQLFEKKQLIRLAIKGEAHSCLTSLLHVATDTGTIVLDRSVSREQNERILAAGKARCETSLDNIRIFFTVEGISETTFDGSTALRATFPASLVRLQRREFYRMTTPVTHPVLATIPLPAGQGESEDHALLPLADISCGGIALLDNMGLLGTTIGQTFDNCVIGLPDIGPVTGSLQIRYALDVPLLNNKTNRRLGMQFIDMPHASLSAVQRYITRLERERNARLAGLA
ncbi:flagellar brake protein [Massilia norwichensis]|uniref:Flagellar brake protein YcgR n=1 Tax=Massilia norwichensis TaxID=1442366 RepID=A0ABT2A5K1_9BURK|nr:flagellar brake protein [Massilia norwichensis]MCS0589471.1 flagellar brake protein [Massilia norwichensis]